MKRFKVMPYVMATMLTCGSALLVNGQSDNNAVTDSDTIGHNDAAFITRTIEDNMEEIEMAKMAINKSEDEDIKEIAEMLVKDHSKMVDKLKKVADKKDIPLQLDADKIDNNGRDMTDSIAQSKPGDTGTASNQLDIAGTKTSKDLDPESANDQTTITRSGNDRMGHDALETATGKQFDSMWVAHMLINHKIKLGDLHEARRSTDDPELKKIVQDAIASTRIHRDRLIEVYEPSRGISGLNKNSNTVAPE